MMATRSRTASARTVFCTTCLLLATRAACFSFPVRSLDVPGAVFPHRQESSELTRGTRSWNSGTLTFRASAQQCRMQSRNFVSDHNRPLGLRTSKQKPSIPQGLVYVTRETALSCTPAKAGGTVSSARRLWLTVATFLRKAVLNGLILGTIVLLEVIDVFLNVMAIIATMAKSLIVVPLRLFKPTSTRKQKAVIVGGSFAGLAVARGLRKKFDVTIIDKRDHFEYTPGVLRLFVQPQHFSALTTKLRSHRGVKFMQGSVTTVEREYVEVSPAKASAATAEPSRVEYDVLVLACGSGYGDQGIKHGDDDCGLEARKKAWERSADKVAKAEKLLVVGTGPVGVELAAEVLAAHPEKDVTLAGSALELCDDFAVQATKDYSRAWIEERGGRLVLGGRCVQDIEKSPPARKGQVYRCGVDAAITVAADHAIWCFGAKPDTGFLRRGVIADSLGPGGAIMVRGSMQVEGQERVFALGDAVQVQGGQPHAKLGHTAEVQARVVCRNVERVMAAHCATSAPQASPSASGGHQRLAEYVPTAEHTMYALSLGKYHASIRFGPIVLSGFVAAYLKWAVEWTKVAQAGGRRVGELCWSMADFITARTVDKMAEAEPADPGEVSQASSATTG